MKTILEHDAIRISGKDKYGHNAGICLCIGLSIMVGKDTLDLESVEEHSLGHKAQMRKDQLRPQKEIVLTGRHQYIPW